jgi:hypothetical protein
MYDIQRWGGLVACAGGAGRGLLAGGVAAAAPRWAAGIRDSIRPASRSRIPGLRFLALATLVVWAALGGCASRRPLVEGVPPPEVLPQPRLMNFTGRWFQVAGALEGRVETVDDLPPEGYRIRLAPGRLRVQAGGPAGGRYAARTLDQLKTLLPTGTYLPEGEVEDRPAFARRGFIRGGGSVAEILDLLDFAAGLKLNFYFFDTRGALPAWRQTEIRSVVEGCRQRGIEFCALEGWAGFGLQEAYSDADMRRIRAYFDERFDLGIRSFSVCFDDRGYSGVGAGREHAALANDVFAHLRRRDPEVRLIFCPSPYGGTPRRFAEGPWGVEADVLAYWRSIKGTLDPSIEAFWTGDGGVFSPRVTVEAAKEFAEAVGRKPILWDNDALRFWSWVRPAEGRDPGLAAEATGIMANVNEQEAQAPELGKFALATIADYAWNPEAYRADLDRGYRYVGGRRWPLYKRLVEAGREGFARYAGFPSAEAAREAAQWRELIGSMGSSTALDREVRGHAARRLARLERCLEMGVWAHAPDGGDPTEAVDGDPQTAWNAMRGPPAWIELRFAGPRRIRSLELTVQQSPPGATAHEIRVDGALVRTLEGETRQGEVLRIDFDPPVEARAIRIDTIRSLSWVAWGEIAID